MSIAPMEGVTVQPKEDEVNLKFFDSSEDTMERNIREERENDEKI